MVLKWWRWGDGGDGGGGGGGRRWELRSLEIKIDGQTCLTKMRSQGIKIGCVDINDSIVGLVLLMLLLIFILFLLACKPWRWFFSSSRNRSIKVGDLERPLVSEDLDQVANQSSDLARDFVLDGSRLQVEGYFNSPRAHGFVCKQRLPSADAHVTQGASLVVDVISDSSEDLLVGQTLKRPFVPNRFVEEQKYAIKEEPNYDPTFLSNSASYREFIPNDIQDQRSSLTLEVVSGPSCGLRCSLQSTDTSRLPLTLGRVPPSDLLLKDGEVSGKHALVNWNLNKLKWELVDMGSLNGTFLNSHHVHHPDSRSRQWSEPVELATGDIITLGTTSKVTVKISPHGKQEIPFGVGMASDPMALRRGGKKLPMEDVCYYQWPLPGVEQFGLFGICDGHGGPGAAKAASKILPKMVTNILSVSEKREMVLSSCDASDILRDAFFQTEAAMHHQYEGCTATLLLVWTDGHEKLFAQCANVGDSACIMNIGGKQIKMTEDHRITSQSERRRLNETGDPLKDGETRLCGLNLARMLGDKFLKEQEARFSSVPYISQVVHINKDSRAFALMASDGLWDVISVKKAMQLVLQTRERYAAEKGNTAEKIANFVLCEARSLRTKDNTSIIFLDFDSYSRTGLCKVDS
ncbi:Forkhead-associated (FHA) domain [Macleaya cordata]|uniref:protein-serine/threonine phosphatase n=1 Tax=Macleaya cordata TaxID=56857 RepID=A0A200Q8G5_MACCD|nr:Forkhead-associated (FHA) domain [Macleaya cordata]